MTPVSHPGTKGLMGGQITCNSMVQGGELGQVPQRRGKGAGETVAVEEQARELGEPSQPGGDGPGQRVIPEAEVGERRPVLDPLRDGARQVEVVEADPVDRAPGAVAADAGDARGSPRTESCSMLGSESREK